MYVAKSVTAEELGLGGSPLARSCSCGDFTIAPARTTAVLLEKGDSMWRRVSSIMGSVVFLFVAPGTVAGLVPWWMSQWRIQDPRLGLEFIRWIGMALILVGAAILLEAFAR